ncbi:MAG TPA: hypothetical protein VIH59_30515 [Candidatus Tectomicrobia bacterium]|jgi:hypothetical protein
MAQDTALQHNVKVLERGDIYFVYRPRLEQSRQSIEPLLQGKCA